MTRLDHNRAVAALAKKANVNCADVTCVTIWGNHSNTQWVDFQNAKIDGKPATDVIKDRAWLENSFLPQCQTRGAAVIKARGLSSAMSAANGAIDHVKLVGVHPALELAERRPCFRWRVWRAAGTGLWLPRSERRKGRL